MHILAPCDEEMVPQSDFPVIPSSPGESPEGVTDENAEAWKPENDDEKPSLTIDISDEPTFIENVQVTAEKTKNVKKVTVVVKDEDGNAVVRSQFVHHYFIDILLKTVVLFIHSLVAELGFFVYPVLRHIQCFISFSGKTDPTDCKSAGCKFGTLGEFFLLMKFKMVTIETYVFP